MISFPDYYMDLVRGLDPLHKRIEFSAESDIVAVASVGLWPVAAAVNVLAAASVLKVSSSDVKDDAAGENTGFWRSEKIMPFSGMRDRISKSGFLSFFRRSAISTCRPWAPPPVRPRPG